TRTPMCASPSTPNPASRRIRDRLILLKGCSGLLLTARPKEATYTTWKLWRKGTSTLEHALSGTTPKAGYGFTRRRPHVDPWLHGAVGRGGVLICEQGAGTCESFSTCPAWSHRGSARGRATR